MVLAVILKPSAGKPVRFARLWWRFRLVVGRVSCVVVCPLSPRRSRAWMPASLRDSVHRGHYLNIDHLWREPKAFEGCEASVSSHLTGKQIVDHLSKVSKKDNGLVDPSVCECLPRLASYLVDFAEGDFTLGELLATIWAGPSSLARDPDDLFWSVLKRLDYGGLNEFLSVINLSWSRGFECLLGADLLEALVVLVLKKGGSKSLDNFRGVVNMHTVVKLICGLLARRLDPDWIAESLLDRHLRFSLGSQTQLQCLQLQFHN